MLQPDNNKPFFSIVIPCHNEEGSIRETCMQIVEEFEHNSIEDYEIVIVDDHSSDRTATVTRGLEKEYRQLRLVTNEGERGYGRAVLCGLEAFQGECVCVVMADLSDSPRDIVHYYQLMRDGAECVFGSRFMKGSQVHDYPAFKLVLNRFVNFWLKLLFGTRTNDITNAFKCYRRNVIEGIAPLISPHFNLTVEMPLKAIVRGYQYEVIPISWTNRAEGISKFKIAELGSRYTFSIMYVLLEKWLCRKDFFRRYMGKKQGPQ